MSATHTRITALGASALLFLAACGGTDEEGAPEATPSPPATATASPSEPEPTGAPLSKSDIATLAAAFADQPLTGGQTATSVYANVVIDLSKYAHAAQGRNTLT